MIIVFQTWQQLIKEVGTLNETDLRESINYAASCRVSNRPRKGEVQTPRLSRWASRGWPTVRRTVRLL